MRIYERDYRYLLQKVIPQHRLSPGLRKDITRALDSGASDSLRRESVRALEELCAGSYFVRTAVTAGDNDVRLEYRKRGGRYGVSVAVPADEWHGPGALASSTPGPAIANVPEAEAEPALEEVKEVPEAPAVPELPVFRPDESEAAVRFLPEIINSFAVAGRTDPVLTRLESLLETMETWMSLKGTELLVLEDTVQLTDAPGERVQLVTEEEMRQADLLRRSIETGARRIIPKAEMDDSGSSHVGWGYLGVAPIFVLGKVQGVLQVYFGVKASVAAMETQLGITASVVRQVIEFHQQIENLTSIDALTGIYNRHFYDTQLPVEIERAMRSGGVVSMLVLDIDNFKRINDEIGHKKGDEALTLVADQIRKHLRKVDMPFRYGGEEFVILLPGTSEVEAVHTAERLRRVVEENQGLTDLHGRARRLTVSVGVAVFPDTARSAEDLFIQADSAMYGAKQSGRNRVVLYRDEKENLD